MATRKAPDEQARAKELTLRDRLAIDRTGLANERTLLAYARTGLALVVVGGSLIKFFGSPAFSLAGWLFVAAGGLLAAVGACRFLGINRRLKALGRPATEAMDDADPQRSQQNASS